MTITWAILVASSTTTTTKPAGAPTEATAVGWVIVVAGAFVVASMVIWPLVHAADVRRGIARWSAWDVICVLPVFAWFRVLSR